jgi:hypothetical protein
MPGPQRKLASSIMAHGFRHRFACLIFAGTALFGGALGPAFAHEQAQATSSALPSDKALDAMVAARDWNGLGAALSQASDQASLTRALDWLQAKVTAGGGFMIAVMYARELWTIGEAMKLDDPGRDLRVTAGMMMLYAVELIAIDGAKCEDESAPGHRLDQISEMDAAIFKFLRTQSADIKSKVVDTALALEQRTAPLRRDDDVICRGGLAEMQAGLEHGTQKEVPDASGHYGKDVEVAAPPGWAPKFVPPSTYRPLQEAARASMRENLFSLVD